MIDEALSGVRADDQAGDAQAIAVLVHMRGHDMIVETAPVIP